MTGFTNTKDDAAPSDEARKAAKKAYIVKVGILSWGIPVALAVTGLDWYQGTPVNELAVPLAIRLVLFGILGGVAFGAAMWKYSEYVAKKSAAAKPQA